MRASRLPWLVALLLTGLAGLTDALLVAPLAPGRGRAAAPLARAPAERWLRMQIIDAPVKIPDMVPNFAPAAPSSDQDKKKDKKFKVLLFNDNVNRCAPPAPLAPRLSRHHIDVASS